MVKFLVLLSMALLSADILAFECNPEGNQSEINQCAYDDLAKADRELNTTYKALIEKMAGDKIYVDNLREAQRAWIVFRDKELEAMFSCADENKRICWGSMLGTLYPSAKAELTRERTARLRRYIEEGQNSAIK